MQDHSLLILQTIYKPYTLLKRKRRTSAHPNIRTGQAHMLYNLHACRIIKTHHFTLGHPFLGWWVVSHLAQSIATPAFHRPQNSTKGPNSRFHPPSSARPRSYRFRIPSQRHGSLIPCSFVAQRQYQSSAVVSLCAFLCTFRKTTVFFRFTVH